MWSPRDLPQRTLLHTEVGGQRPASTCSSSGPPYLPRWVWIWAHGRCPGRICLLIWVAPSHEGCLYPSASLSLCGMWGLRVLWTRKNPVLSKGVKFPWSMAVLETFWCPFSSTGGSDCPLLGAWLLLRAAQQSCRLWGEGPGRQDRWRSEAGAVSWEPRRFILRSRGHARCPWQFISNAVSLSCWGSGVVNFSGGRAIPRGHGSSSATVDTHQSVVSASSSFEISVWWQQPAVVTPGPLPTSSTCVQQEQAKPCRVALLLARDALAGRCRPGKRSDRSQP